MPFPETWIKAAVEQASGCLAYPMMAPEAAALPYVVYGRQSTTRETTMPLSAGSNIPPIGTFILEIYAAKYTDAKTIADDVRQALHNFNGSASGVTIRHAALANERDGDPVFFDGQDTPTFTIEHTYEIRWEE